MINLIIKWLWPILIRFFKPDIKTQNYYNEPETEKKVKRSDKEPKEQPGKFHWPVLNLSRKITSPFGPRKLRGRTRMHYGIDVIGAMVYDVIAAENGVVVKILPPNKKTPARWAKRAGKWIRLASNKNSPTPYVLVNAWNGTQQLYAHVKASVRIGQEVKAGKKIGTYKGPAKTGGYGNSYGDHLHFEVREKIGGKFKPVDPKKYALSRA